MKTRFKIIFRWMLVLLLVVVVVTTALKQNAIARLRAEHDSLINQTQEARRLTEENLGVDKLREENGELEKLQRETKDLPGLRNEVRQLRRQVEELEKLRMENQRLLALQEGAVTSERGQRLANFIPKTALIDAGLATPEATIETYFWAANQGNIKRVEETFQTPRSSTDQDTGELRRGAADFMSRFPGFAIVEKQEISPEEVILKLQTSIGGVIMPMKLHQVGNEWKIVN